MREIKEKCKPMNQILFLNSVPESLNKLFNLHYRTRAKHKIDVEQEVWLECKSQKIKPVKGSVSLNFIFTFKTNRKRDLDNYPPKFQIDGLRKAGILSEDNSDVVKQIYTSFKQGKKELTEINIQTL